MLESDQQTGLALLDELVLEYMVFRGFIGTFKSFQAEKSRDRMKGLDSEAVTDELFKSILDIDVNRLFGLWDFLELRFFCLLDPEYAQTKSAIKASLMKLFLVTASKRGESQKVQEFLSKFGHEVLGDEEQQQKTNSLNVRVWFSLPFIPSPEKDSYFAPYFSPTWSDMLRVATHNFLSVIFRNSPPPRLLALERFNRTNEQRQLKRELRNLREIVDSMQRHLSRTEVRLSEFRTTVRELVHYIYNQVSSPVAFVNGSYNRSVLFKENEQIEDFKQTVKKLGGDLTRLTDKCQTVGDETTAAVITQRNRLMVSSTAKLSSSISSCISSGMTGNNMNAINLMDKEDYHRRRLNDALLLINLRTEGVVPLPVESVATLISPINNNMFLTENNNKPLMSSSRARSPAVDEVTPLIYSPQNTPLVSLIEMSVKVGDVERRMHTDVRQWLAKLEQRNEDSSSWYNAAAATNTSTNTTTSRKSSVTR